MDGLNEEFLQWLREQGILCDWPDCDFQDGMVVREPVSVYDQGALSKSTVKIVDLRKLLQVRPVVAATLAVGGDVYAIAHADSKLGIGLLAAGVLLAAYHATRDYVRDVLNQDYAAVLVAMRDFRCPTGVAKESLHLKTNMLLEAEGEAGINEKKFENMLKRLSGDLKCIEIYVDGRVCLKEKVRYA